LLLIGWEVEAAVNEIIEKLGPEDCSRDDRPRRTESANVHIQEALPQCGDGVVSVIDADMLIVSETGHTIRLQSKAQTSCC